MSPLSYSAQPVYNTQGTRSNTPLTTPQSRQTPVVATVCGVALGVAATLAVLHVANTTTSNLALVGGQSAVMQRPVQALRSMPRGPTAAVAPSAAQWQATPSLAGMRAAVSRDSRLMSATEGESYYERPSGGLSQVLSALLLIPAAALAAVFVSKRQPTVTDTAATATETPAPCSYPPVPRQWSMASTAAQELGGKQPNEVELCEFTKQALAGNNPEHDLLLRAARGEKTSRPPVWLMRQAGRYMAAFRAYSENYPFRQRSETPEMAIAMSLQPWHAFGTDGVIMFSDILTPWPVFGVEFDVVRGKGPQIPDALNTVERMEAVKSPNTPEEFAEALPFIKEILGTLREETEGKTTLIGFVGSPWTMVAYAMEGGGSKNCEVAMRLMQNEPEACKRLLTKVAEGIAAYSAYQVSCGAQVLQVFESWAHQMSPELFDEFAKPFADLCIKKIKEQCPDTPVIYFANGGSGFLERQGDMAADMICLDWKTDMASARQTLGMDRAVSGNVDPRILHSGTEAQIRQAVQDCASKAKGTPFVLNVGHGVMQGTPEASVGYFCDEARKVKLN